MVEMIVLLIAIACLPLLSLFLVRRQRRDSARGSFRLRSWAATLGVPVREEEGDEGKVESFFADRGPSSFACEYAGCEKTGASPRLVLSVACPLPADLEIFRETFAQRLSKKLGLDREVQTREPYFDREFYLQTEAAGFYRALFSHRDVRCLVSELFGPNDSKRKLVFKDGHIRLIVSPATPWHLARLKVDRAGELLAALARAVACQRQGSKEVFSESFRKGQDAAVEKRLKASHFVYPLLLAAGSILLSRAGRAEVLDVDSGFVGLAVLLALALTALLAVAGYFAFRGTAHSRKLLLGLLSAYLTANFLFSQWAIVFVNCQLDRGPAWFQPARVVDKVSSREWFFAASYKLFVILDNERGTRSLDVSRATYARFPANSRVRIVRKPGRLGVAWISGIRPLPDQLAPGLMKRK